MKLYNMEYKIHISYQKIKHYYLEQKKNVNLLKRKLEQKIKLKKLK